MSRRRRCRRGPVRRVVRGLADAFGLPRGVVIAGFVIGLLSVPLLTVMVFLAVLMWVDHPDRVRRYADTARDVFRRATDRLRHGADAGRRHGPDGDRSRETHEPSRAPPDPSALARRLRRIERRTRTIEEFVASEEFRLDREFRRMGR